MDHVDLPAAARLGCFVSCAVAAALWTTTAAQAAVPKVGAWESGSRSEPRVSFDVRGQARSRRVRRVSFPITCKGAPAAIGWGSTDTAVRVRSGGRFTAHALESAIRGRFTAGDRAVVRVRSSSLVRCEDTRRYVVRLRGRRLPVRNGRFLSLVRGGAALGLETSAFGRMVRVQYMEGSLPAACSDGSQRPLALAGPDGLVLAAPIRPNGRFDIAAALGSSIEVAGTFDGGSVAALLDLSVVLPDGTRCTALTQPLVGSLAFPVASAGETATFPGPPLVRRQV